MGTSRRKKAPGPRGDTGGGPTARPQAGNAQPGSAAPSLRGIVAIGASAGGLAAARRLLTRVPADSGFAFVLIQHLDPAHASLTAEILGRTASIPALEASEGMGLRPDRLHVNPPGMTLTMSCEGSFHLEPQPRTGLHRPVDAFFSSLAEIAGESAIAVVLSGAGADGTEGIRRIRERGGLVIAQDPETADCDGMPTSAIATGLVHQVAAPEEIAEIMMSGPSGRSALVSTGASLDTDGGLDEVLALLRSKARQDFSQYKRDTLRRRVQRRMATHRIDRLEDYLDLLGTREDEATQLARDLHISVTSFLREPKAFEVLQEKVLAPLIGARTPGRPIRIWVPGCATGEEAYTIAILALEVSEGLQASCEIQIFATDRSSDALEVARAGTYPSATAGDMGPDRLRRFFVPVDGGRYQIARQVREMVTFAQQDIIGDPPFSKLDLISCRNLLIYLETRVQGNVVVLFHFALNPGGFLFLGPSETTGPHSGLFEAVSKRWRIYRRLEPLGPTRVDFPFGSTVGERTASAIAALPPSPSAPGMWDHVQPSLLEHFGAAAVLIDRRGQVLQLAGLTDRFLAVPSREARFDLSSLAREGIAAKLRAAIRRALTDGRRARTGAATIHRAGSTSRARATVIPQVRQDAPPDTLLVVFEELDRVVAAPTSDSDMPESEIVDALERELQATQERLQTTVEEMKAAHEEVVSMNEELQSSNEELETSKEELQSLNEELATVNNQLQEKLEELEAANADTTNLLLSSDTPTFILDEELRIRRFTTATQRVLSVIPGDLGRPIKDIAWRFRDEELEEAASGVMRTGAPTEREVLADDGRWFLRRVLPYRTQDGRIAGAVVTLSDVSRLKEAEEHWRRLAAVLSDSNDALTVQDFDGRILSWNQAASRMYGWTEAEAVGQSVIQLIVPEDRRRGLQEVMGRLRRGEVVPSFETERLTKDSRRLTVWLTATALRDRGGSPVLLATTERDVTERRLAETALQESERFANAIFDTSPVGIQVFGADGTFERMNAAQRHLPPRPQKDGDKPINVLKDSVFGASDLGSAFRRAYQGHVVELPETNISYERAGRRRAIALEQLLFPVRDEQGRVQAVISLCHNVTERKVARERDSQRLESLGVLAGGIAHDFNNLLAAMLGHVDLAAFKLPHDHPSRPDLEVARKAIDRAADLTRQMLAYSGRGKIQVRLVDLSEVVRDNLRLLRVALPKRVQVDSQLAQGLPAIAADAGQLQQVVMNLVTNAAEAIGPDGGTVRVTTHARDLGLETEELSGLAGARLPSGEHVFLEVADEGCGMDEETAARMFDPFFTTKATGRGLGLSAVLGIVRAHNGGISVRSAPGQGSTFRVAFPAYSGTETEMLTEPREPEAELESVSALVLVIDDEELIRNLSATVLARAGFRSLLAPDGLAGVEALEKHAGEVEVVILDLSMPGLSPAETIRRLRAVKPGVRLVVTSGFSEPDALLGLEGITAFIPKPSTPAVYVEAVRAALRGESGR